MTTYPESAGLTLLTGAQDLEGDPIRVRRVDGTIVDWTNSPHIVTLPIGRLRMWDDGTARYDDLGTTTGHPTAGQTNANGSFTFTLWDGTDESAEYTCSVALSAPGTGNQPPSGQNQSLQFDVTAP